MLQNTVITARIQNYYLTGFLQSQLQLRVRLDFPFYSPLYDVIIVWASNVSREMIKKRLDEDVLVRRIREELGVGPENSLKPAWFFPLASDGSYEEIEVDLSICEMNIRVQRQPQDNSIVAV